MHAFEIAIWIAAKVLMQGLFVHMVSKKMEVQTYATEIPGLHVT
jgi:hypothetical protein